MDDQILPTFLSSFLDVMIHSRMFVPKTSISDISLNSSILLVQFLSRTDSFNSEELRDAKPPSDFKLPLKLHTVTLAEC